ncbi:efflux RND transporter periplasmic adaptor subunit [Yoonia sp.]|uniref:efflux RND transporter periplasmic adaptor subunit n=1 Tax=Yoonia sp. TaxID=2212373 RepID=UPI00391D50A1
MVRWLNATTLVFVAIVALVVVWIGSGFLSGDETAQDETVPPTAGLPSVAASWSDAEETVREITLYGEVRPAQISTLRARVQGIVEEIAPAGTEVEAGQIVGRLSADDREAQLARAEAQLAAAQSDYNAARQLADRDITPEAEAQTRFAQLQAARAELRAVELEITYTQLAAPGDGIVNELYADVGALVTAGGEVAEIVDNDPLVAVVQVQQGSIGDVRAGMPARVRFIGGGTAEGAISFVAPVASAETRTFRVEVEINNPEGALPSGLSAEVVIPYDTVAAHRLSPALGLLDSEGRLGVHLVDDEDRIVFAPIVVVEAEAGGIWATGLPKRARIVTISQGALAQGQQVEVRETPPEYLTGTATASETGAAAAEAAAPAGNDTAGE